MQIYIFRSDSFIRMDNTDAQPADHIKSYTNHISIRPIVLLLISPYLGLGHTFLNQTHLDPLT